jgi:hypothetical protein
LLKHGAKNIFQKGSGSWGIQLACFDLLYQSGASALQESHMIGKALNYRGIKRTLKCGRGCQYPHNPREGVFGSRFDGWFHAHEWNCWESQTQIVQGGCGGGVAGDNDHLRPLVEQVLSDFLRELADLLQWALPIWDVSLVCEEQCGHSWELLP